MGRRRKTTVTLPVVRALAAVPTTTLPPDAAPTPERLARAGYTVAMQLGTGRVQVIGADAKGLLGYDGVVRVEQAPLDRLHARGRLDEDDPERNRQLYEAGEKLLSHHHRAGLSGFVTACNDLGRVGRSDPARREVITETMERSRRALRTAEASVDPDAWLAVRAVVLHEQNLEDLGRVLGFGNRHAAASVGLDRLRRGLRALAALWGFAPPERPTDLQAGEAANADAPASESAAA